MQALLDAIAAAPDLSTDAHRLFHGRGGRFPGCEHLALDAYPPVLLLTSFQPLADDALAVVGTALAARWPEMAWVYQCRGAGAETRLMAGAMPEVPWAVRKGAVWWLRHRERAGVAEVVLVSVRTPEKL